MSKKLREIGKKTWLDDTEFVEKKINIPAFSPQNIKSYVAKFMTKHRLSWADFLVFLWH